MAGAPDRYDENGEPEKILLVDDNPTNLQVLMQTLDGQGYQLLVAKNGEGAIEIARKSRPSLILLDIMMPGIDGFETCRRLKSDERTRETPVIFLSAMGETADKVKGLELGAVDYVTKPIQTEEVIARVRTHLTIRRLKREVEARYADIERELRVVANVQRSLLPRELPEIEGLQLAAYYASSRHAGGDYYDVVPLPDNRWGILIADVSGHGTPSAVMMAMTRAIFHAHPGPQTDPDEVLTYLNAHLIPALDFAFVTALYAVYDATARTLRIARAGHPEAIVYRPDRGETVELTADAVYPLGLFPYDGVPTTEHTLHPGDRLLLYTDGIVERFNPDHQDYGIERLRRQLGRCCVGSPSQTVDAIMADVDRFAGTHPPDDDQTVLLGLLE